MTVRSMLARPATVVRSVPAFGTWAGLLLIGAGFVLLIVAWGTTAGLTDVGKQMPYLMSAGVVGLCLVCCGLTAVVLDARSREAARHHEQSRELVAAIAELRSIVEGGP